MKVKMNHPKSARTYEFSKQNTEQIKSSSSSRSKSPMSWDNDLWPTPDFFVTETKIRPSSWDDSDDESIAKPSNTETQKTPKSSAGSKTTTWEDYKPEGEFEECDKIKTNLAGIDRRQSPARVKRRTKSSNSSSPVLESKTKNPPEEEFPKEETDGKEVAFPETDGSFCLDNFFSELRSKRISFGEWTPQVDSVCGTNDNSEFVPDTLDIDEDGYCRTFRKLSQILEVEEIKRDSDVSLANENPPEEPKKSGPLFLKNFQNEVLSPLPTARSKEPKTPDFKKAYKEKSISLEELEKKKEKKGNLSERFDFFRYKDNDEIIFLTSKTGVTEITDNTEILNFNLRQPFEKKSEDILENDLAIVGKFLDLKKTLKSGMSVSVNPTPRKPKEKSDRSSRSLDEELKKLTSPRFKIVLDSARSTKMEDVKSCRLEETDRKTNKSSGCKTRRDDSLGGHNLSSESVRSSKTVQNSTTRRLDCKTSASEESCKEEPFKNFKDEVVPKSNGSPKGSEQSFKALNSEKTELFCPPKSSHRSVTSISKTDSSRSNKSQKYPLKLSTESLKSKKEITSGRTSQRASAKSFKTINSNHRKDTDRTSSKTVRSHLSAPVTSRGSSKSINSSSSQTPVALSASTEFLNINLNEIIKKTSSSESYSDKNSIQSGIVESAKTTTTSSKAEKDNKEKSCSGRTEKSSLRLNFEKSLSFRSDEDENDGSRKSTAGTKCETSTGRQNEKKESFVRKIESSRSSDASRRSEKLSSKKSLEEVTNPTDGGEWEDLIEEFDGVCNSSGGFSANNFPGFPPGKNFSENYSLKSRIATDKQKDKGRYSGRSVDFSTSNDNTQKKLPTDLDISPKSGTTQPFSSKTFYFDLEERKPFGIGEFGDITCWNIGKLESDKPKDHGDGNHQNETWVELFPKFPEKELKNQLTERKEISDKNPAETFVFDRLKLSKSDHCINTKETKTIRSMRWPEKSSGASSYLEFSRKSKRTPKNASSSSECSETGSAANLTRLPSISTLEINLEDANLPFFEKIQKDSGNTNVFLANNAEERTEVKENNWLIIGGPKGRRRSRKPKTRFGVSREWPWREESSGSGRTPVTPLKLRSSGCLRNFYKRLVRVFCLTSDSSAATTN